jgi:YfiH family protein
LNNDWIFPDWPAPKWVRSVITTRHIGYSDPPYHSFNLGDHVGDDPERVAANRRLLRQKLGLPVQPFWLRQVHGCRLAHADSDSIGCEADAVMADQPGRVCAVLTADCLPVLLCNQAGSRVAAVHAGWRGLVDGVIEQALAGMGGPARELLAWLGPAIGPQAFEVGDEVRSRFMASYPGAAQAFVEGSDGRWFADIYTLAKQRLAGHGVGFIGGGDYCTVSDPERFFSYRRDGVTGRMASLIWISTD